MEENPCPYGGLPLSPKNLYLKGTLHPLGKGHRPCGKGGRLYRDRRSEGLLEGLPEEAH